MNKKKLLKVSLISLICSIVTTVISYFFYHFVTDSGISLTWNPEPGKPFVSEMLGDLTILFLFAAAISLIFALVVYGDEDKK